MFRRSRLGGATLAAAISAAALAAAPAQAAPEWHDGSIESSSVANCNFFPETGIVANAQFQADPEALPKVGEVFYVRTIPARVGYGCGIAMHVHVEIVPPLGVTPAISLSTPVRCLLWDYNTDETSPLSGCPQEAQAGIYGPAFDQLTPGGPHEISPWEVPYGKGIVMEIPLRSSRELVGGGSGAPSCGRFEGEPPCSASAAGDNLQFANKVSDGWGDPWLSPHVPLFVEAASGGEQPDPDDPGNPDDPGPGGDGGPVGGNVPVGGGTSAGGTNPGGPAPGGGTLTSARLIASAPASARRSQLRRGLPLKVRVTEAGSRVKATLTLRKRTIASRSVRAASARTVALRLKPSKRGARQLKRLRRPARAVLRVVVTEPDGRKLVAKRKVKIRP